jgi:4-hydroxymandelate oxidase
MKGICGVFGTCNGDRNRVCQNHSYGSPLQFGGIGSGTSFWNNFVALDQVRLNMQTILPHFIADTSMELFGLELSMPIMPASVSGVNSFGGEAVITESAFCEAVIKGSKQAGTIGWRGDTYTYSHDQTPGLDAIEHAEGWGIKICKPRAQEDIIHFYKHAERIGAKAVGIDVDGAYSHAMTRHHKAVFHKSVDDLKELRQATSLPFIIKGIMGPFEAQTAVEAGADAIVVSNHGGRVLDYTPGTAEVLPRIVSEVGNQVKVLVDGGVRTGFDVLKMLALGADAVLIGRDIVRAAVGGGSEGVRLQLEYLQKTLLQAMSMTGVAELKKITKQILL